MLLFLCLTLIIIVFSISVFKSEIRLHVYNFEYSNYRNLTNENKIKLELYLFGIIKVLSIKLKKEKINKKITKNIIKEKFLQIKDIKSNADLLSKKGLYSFIKEIVIDLTRKIEIKQLKFYASIGIDDVAFTSILIGILYTIINNILRINIKKYNRNMLDLKISPIYNCGNKVYAKFECIIAIKLVHIINMLKNAKYGKESYGIYERTSNRRVNVNSHGKHKEYDRC